MLLFSDDVFTLASGQLPMLGESVLLVYANYLVVPARREASGWIDVRTCAPPLGEPIGWTYHKEPLIKPKGDR